MSKVVRAVNAMLANQDKITDVVAGSDARFYFAYKAKHKWAVAQHYDDTTESWGYSLTYIADNRPPHVLADEKCIGADSVCYSTDEINTKEARESFASLYAAVKEKLYGVDSALDDIIEDEIPF